MPYRKLHFAKDCFYHLFSRGNHKSPIFFNPADYERFLSKLRIYKDKFEVEIINYALLPNHFHLEVKQIAENGITRFMKGLLNSHSHYFSLKNSLQGHLFEASFKGKLIQDESYLLRLFRYISLQPIKEKILGLNFIRKGGGRDIRRNKQFIYQLRNFPWGGYREYLNPSDKDITSKNLINNLLKTERNLKDLVEDKITPEDIIDLDKLSKLRSGI